MERLHIMPDMFTSLSHIILKNKNLYEASLVVKNCQPTQGTRVQSLAQEDSACPRAAKPVASTRGSLCT